MVCNLLWHLNFIIWDKFFHYEVRGVKSTFDPYKKGSSLPLTLINFEQGSTVDLTPFSWPHFPRKSVKISMETAIPMDAECHIHWDQTLSVSSKPIAFFLFRSRDKAWCPYLWVSASSPELTGWQLPATPVKDRAVPGILEHFHVCTGLRTDHNAGSA